LSICPRCGEPAATGQEYCLECGLRLSGPELVTTREAASGWMLRAAVTGAVALIGAGVAVAASGGSGGEPEMITATGGFATAPASSTLPSPGDSGSSAISEWPQGEDGWTVALASLPQSGGRPVAVARARKARARGLPQVGVLDSSRYASLHPGYWIVFSGIYSSEAEATSAIEAARAFARTASVRRVVS
jgi:hypothetical protein